MGEQHGFNRSGVIQLESITKNIQPITRHAGPNRRRAMAMMNMQGDVMSLKRSRPRQGEMIPIEVGQENVIDVGQGEAERCETLSGLTHGQAAVDQRKVTTSAILHLEKGAVARRSAAQYAQ